MSSSTAAQMSPIEYRAGIVRDFVFPVAATLAVALIPFHWIWIGLVVLGQAHFFTAYLYQYKGKKMNALYGVSAVLLAIIAAAYFVLDLGIWPIMLTAATIFAAHFALDEFTLHGETITPPKAVTIVGFATLHLSFLAAALFPALASAASLTALVFLIAIAVRLKFASAAPSAAEKYLWFVGIILFMLSFVLGVPGQLLGVILLLHFVNWYVGYGDRLKEKQERSRAYWTEVWVILGLAFGLYMLYTVAGVSWLKFIFEPVYFYAWAIAHIVLSFMTATYRFQNGAW